MKRKLVHTEAYWSADSLTQEQIDVLRQEVQRHLEAYLKEKRLRCLVIFSHTITED